jgi:ribosomal protein L32
MAEKTYRKCPNCGKMSLNQDYCPACGTIINTTLKRELARKEKAAKKQQEAAVPKKKSAVTIFLENSKDHQNPFIKYTARFFYSIWIVVIAIGSFLALLFGYIAA